MNPNQPDQHNEPQTPIQPQVGSNALNNTPAPKSSIKIPGKEFITNLVAKLPTPLQDVLYKFYANKMIFWTITILFGLMFVIIILGVLFGSAGTPQPVKTAPKPTPYLNTQPTASPSGNVLQQTQFQLSALKDKINALDVRQSPLKPPPFNFDIKF